MTTKTKNEELTVSLTGTIVATGALEDVYKLILKQVNSTSVLTIRRGEQAIRFNLSSKSSGWFAVDDNSSGLLEDFRNIADGRKG